MRGRFQFVLLVVLSVFCSFSSFLRADVLHVPGDFSTIQGAIDASADGDEIVVEEGTYHEAINFTGKAINLHSASGRDSTTIDATDLNASVVTCSSGEGAETILDGFTITGGLGTEVEGRFLGGGMYNLNSSPTVSNCTFSDMVRTSSGAGMYNENSSPAVENCMFLRNQAGEGGGMANVSNSQPIVAGCTFDENEAGLGGGMYNQSSSPGISDCVFSRTHGTMSTNGGGMANFLDSSPSILNCEFNDNIALNGGGIYNLRNSSPTIIRSSFTGNLSGNNGAGMYNEENSSPLLMECSFDGNIADGNSGDNNGGGIYIQTSSPQIKECTFNNNHAGDNGGGIYIALQSSVRVFRCTFMQNSTGRLGGGAIFLTWDSTANISSSRFTEHTGSGAVYLTQNSTATISASTFTENSGLGAVYITKDSSLDLKSDVFERNSTDGEGGGAIYHDGNDLSISGCQFIGNEGTKGGAVMLAFENNPTMTVTNTRFTGNIATDSGGALHLESQTVEVIANCIFDDNSSPRGGAIYGLHNDMKIVNSTLIGNSAGNGGALYNDFSTTDPVIANCIFDDNTATVDGNHIFNNSGAEPRIAYSNIESSGGSGGNWDTALGVDLGGNIDSNPMFVNSGDGDFQLRSGSPCIDAGANDAVPIDIEFDFNYHPRFVDDPFVTDTGLGDPPVVDMGAFEFQAEVGPTLVVSPNPLVAGGDAEFTLTNARADSETFLVYSLSGLGSVFIGDLNVTLDLDNPMRVNGSKFTDADGVVHYVTQISEKGKGLNIWFQSVQQNLKTEVVATEIR